MAQWRDARRRQTAVLRPSHGGCGAGREATAVGVGVFIGCLPFYGAHLALCWITGWLFGLNRLKVYIAANISNPLFAPTLIFAELQGGAWLRRGAFHPLTLQTARTTDLSVFGLDILTGSLALGATLGAALWMVTYLFAPRDSGRCGASEPCSRRGGLLHHCKHHRHCGVRQGEAAWRPAVSSDGLWGSAAVGRNAGRRRLRWRADIGNAGGGDATCREGRWPSAWNPPPLFDHMIGIEIRPRAASVARAVLGRRHHRSRRCADHRRRAAPRRVALRRAAHDAGTRSGVAPRDGVGGARTRRRADRARSRRVRRMAVRRRPSR